MSVEEVGSSRLEDLFSGVPLSVVFAEAEAIAAAREGADRISLEPPFHVSDDDAYLVLPDDIGLELIDIFADADRDLLDEALRDGLLVVGSIEREGKGKVALMVEAAVGAQELLDRGLPYAEEVLVGGDDDPVAALNELPHTRVTVASALVDDDGLEKMLRRPHHVGISWKVPKDADHLAGVDPTYAYSRRLKDGRIGIEAALFSEYEELVMLLRPAVLAPAASA